MFYDLEGGSTEIPDILFNISKTGLTKTKYLDN